MSAIPFNPWPEILNPEASAQGPFHTAKLSELFEVSQGLI